MGCYTQIQKRPRCTCSGAVSFPSLPNLRCRRLHISRPVFLADAFEERGHGVGAGLFGVSFLIHQHARAQHVEDVLPEGIAGRDVLVGEVKGGVEVAVLRFRCR